MTISLSPTPSTTDSPIPPPSQRNDSGRNDLSHKLGAGFGVPVGCVLLAAGLAYIQYSRKKRRKRQEERHQHEQKALDTYAREAAFAENGPHELEAKAPSTTPYIKPSYPKRLGGISRSSQRRNRCTSSQRV
ncbi:MAG: hypothetical protein Q9173_007265, partial [Seirophora scorigena]